MTLELTEEEFINNYSQDTYITLMERALAFILEKDYPRERIKEGKSSYSGIVFDIQGIDNYSFVYVECSLLPQEGFPGLGNFGLHNLALLTEECPDYVLDRMNYLKTKLDDPTIS